MSFLRLSFFHIFLSLLSFSVYSADFAGKTIEWIVPFKENGGTDKWARFYAPLLSQSLPGNPQVVVKNVVGENSMQGANLFAATAKPDGLTILGTSGSTQFPYLLKDNRVNFDYRDWNVVLSSPTGGVVYISPDAKVLEAKHLNNAEVTLTYGSHGATSLDLVPLLAFEMLGVNVDVIFGMKGRSGSRAAYEQGKTNLDYQTSAAYISKVESLVAAGEAIPLMTWGALDKDGNVVRDPSFPKLPSFPEVYEEIHGAKPSGPKWDAWKAFFVAGFPSQKMVFLPEGTPDEIIHDYMNAFNTVVSDSDFVVKSSRRLGTYEQRIGGDAESMLRQAISVQDESVDWVKTWLNEKYDVTFH